jgi:hypothetical protein
VEAGECPRCGREPSFVPTCGPAVAEALCVTCAGDIGTDAWCDGHAGDGEAILARLPDLPAEWAEVTRLWWIATGEVRLATLVRRPSPGLPASVRAAVGGRSDGDAELA